MSFLIFFVLLTINCITSKVESNRKKDPETTQLQVVGSSKRITAGLYARRGQFPFVVTVRGQAVVTCTGSLIHQNWVLTAAHCMTGLIKKYWTIHLGSTCQGKREDGDLYLTSKKGFPHPEYHKLKSGQPVHDVALILLPQAVDFTEYIQPISLAYEPSRNIAGLKLTVAGWGATEDLGYPIEELMYTEIEVYNDSYCRQEWKSWIAAPSEFCALGPNQQSINSGDSGGPAFEYRAGLYFVVGISNSIVRSESKKPAMYARVAHHVDWIYSVMNDSLNFEFQSVISTE